MGNETQEWLDQNILVGFTHSDYGLGDAWHRRQGNSNSYPGAIPEEEVRRKLFGWSPVKVTPHYYDDSEVWTPLRDSRNEGQDAIICSDNGWLLGYHSEGYADHGYSERLLDGVHNLLGDDVQIGTAGLLKGRKVGFVQVSIADSYITTSGEAYKPYILATSSLDGSVANTYQAGITRVVCDNTVEAFGREGGLKVSFKSTANSQDKIDGLGSSREALDLMKRVSESYEEEMERMLSVTITDDQWSKFTESLYPVNGESKRAATVAENRQNALSEIYFGSEMVTPGTTWGAYQAFSTFQNHKATVTTAYSNRVERSFYRDITGETQKDDRKALALLNAI